MWLFLCSPHCKAQGQPGWPPIIYIRLVLVLFYTAAAKGVRGKGRTTQAQILCIPAGDWDPIFHLWVLLLPSCRGVYITSECVISFWLMLFHLKLWLFFPLENGGRNIKLLLWPVMREQRLCSLGEWILDLSWIAGQISPQSGKCICCQVILFLPLGNNYSCIPCKRYHFQPVCF